MKSEKQKTPSLPNWLASKFLNEMYLEEFFGDLEEIYDDRIQAMGKPKARFMYWFDVIHLLFGFTSIRLFKTQNNNTMMLKSMFKIAWRNAIRQRQFSILNLLGLTFGITTSIIIGLYVYDQTTYDSFHEKGDRIYRVNQPAIWQNWDRQFASTGPNVAVALKEDAPEFEEVTRLLSQGAQTTRIISENQKVNVFAESKFYGADGNFFDVFTFEFKSGNPSTALSEPRSLVITKETAERYFGYEEAVGRMIEVKEPGGSWISFEVTGVLADLPHKSHLQFDILVSMSSYDSYLKPRNGNGYGLVFQLMDC